MGWVYNLKNPDAPTDAPRLIAICSTFSFVALCATALRFYARATVKRLPGLDDYATLSSALLGTAYLGVAIAQTRWGQGLANFDDFPLENVVPFSKIQYAGGPIYTLALLGFKVSLLASYLRIGGFNRTYCYVIYVVMAACVVNQLIFTFVLCLACNPVARQWDLSIPGHCIEQLKSYYALAGTSLGFDIIIIILPLPILWKLKLNMRQKVVLIGVFAIGFFITIIQIIRIRTIASLKVYTDSEQIVIWSVVELNLAVIITCIPTYAPLFHAFSQKISSSNARTEGNYVSGSQYPASRYAYDQASNSKSGTHKSMSTFRKMNNGEKKMNSRISMSHEMNTVLSQNDKQRYSSHAWRELDDTESEEHIIRPEDGRIYAQTEVTVETYKR